MTTSSKINTLKIDDLKKIFAKYKDEALNDYISFLKFESISSEPAYRNEVNLCANFVSSYLKEIGFHVESWPTSGHPTIFAQYDCQAPNQPTLLIYNHYDVQPVDPLELWTSPPFEPTIRDGEVYARGAQDNKGQCFYVLLALKALMKEFGSLPINIKLCIEGEEECGSTGLSGILNSRSAELKADYLAIVDLGLPNIHTPTITLGLRGLVTMDVEVQGSYSDLHSGSHGGVAYNPIHALVELLAKARDASGKITIPGFYDDVEEMSEEEKKLVSFDFDEAEYEKTFGIKPSGGETKFNPQERNWLRPTFEVNGITGGYTGSGFKTVIPAKASAKVSCRLVANQDPKKIGSLVANFLEKNAPKGTKVSVHIHKGTGAATRAKPNSPVANAFLQAYHEIFDQPCQRIYCGASVPVVTELAIAADAEVVMVGLGLPDDNIHAPNEHFGLNRIEIGFLSIARAIELLKN